MNTIGSLPAIPSPHAIQPDAEPGAEPNPDSESESDDSDATSSKSDAESKYVYSPTSPQFSDDEETSPISSVEVVQDIAHKEHT